MFVTYSFGNVVRLDPKFRAFYNDLSSMTHSFLNRWAKGGDEHITNIPTILSNFQFTSDKNIKIGYNAYNFTTDRVAKGDFIRMKEISLTYDFPTNMFKNAAVKNMSIKLQATNLFLIYADKKLNGQDPEFFNVGGVASPMPKQYTLTLKVGI